MKSKPIKIKPVRIRLREKGRISTHTERVASQLSDELETVRTKIFYVCGSKFYNEIKAKSGLVETSILVPSRYSLGQTPAQFVRQVRATTNFGGICPLDERAYDLLNQGTNLRPTRIKLSSEKSSRKGFDPNRVYR
jgi:hypothetical protein